MPTPIPANRSIDFDIQGSTGEWVPRTVDDVRSEAIRALNYYGTVEALTVTKLSSRLLAPLWDWTYSASLRLRTRYSHADIGDLNAIVAGAFYSASGEPATVTSSSYGQIQGPGVSDESPSQLPALLGVSSITIVAAVAVAVFVAKRG